MVVPVLLDDDAKGEKATEAAYEQILDVLGALAANDERIVEYLRTISQGKKWRGSPILEAEPPVGLDIDAAEFANAVELRAWKRLARLSWRPFDEARRYVQGLRLRNLQEWETFRQSTQRPPDIPSNPNVIYRDAGWISLGDWLGTGTVAPRDREHRSFQEARTFVRGLGLSSAAEWSRYAASQSRPADIPAAPQSVYVGRGWAGFFDWLGAGRRCKFGWRPFAEARDFVRNLGLRSLREWKDYVRSGTKPDDIPSNPNATYAAQGWKGMGDWLGTVSNDRKI